MGTWNIARSMIFQLLAREPGIFLCCFSLTPASAYERMALSVLRGKSYQPNFEFFDWMGDIIALAWKSGG